MFNMFAGAPNISTLPVAAGQSNFSGMLSGPSFSPQISSILVESVVKSPICRGDILILKLNEVNKRTSKYCGNQIKAAYICNATSANRVEHTNREHIINMLHTFPDKILVIVASEAVTWVRNGGSSTEYVVSIPFTVEGTDILRSPICTKTSETPGELVAFWNALGIKAFASTHTTERDAEKTCYFKPGMSVFPNKGNIKDVITAIEAQAGNTFDTVSAAGSEQTDEHIFVKLSQLYGIIQAICLIAGGKHLDLYRLWK